MKKIVFLGGKELGAKCLEELFSRQAKLDYEILAVGVAPRGKEIKEFCQHKGIRILSDIQELLELEFDILLSVQYHEVLSSFLLKCAQEIALNLHLAPLPEYRGCNQFSFAILNEDKEFGVSIHKMEGRVDGGDIAFQVRFEIPKNCFVGELVDLANKKGFELFCDSLPKILKGEYSLISQDSIYSCRREFHTRAEIENLKNIHLESCGGGGFN
ncbi:formyltransferase family protein [Helicobacter sp. MIT 05-5294]|uniref:formyltransferase family protein n=1 Tax=Helicobacter sp. MIT 05-5294 TaxID=1548150 RepID=UPI001EE83A7F|nr:formyltransferase family protein [Helicobacter sp. MIT 05-5294]